MGRNDSFPISAETVNPFIVTGMFNFFDAAGNTESALIIVNKESPVWKAIIESALMMKRSESALYVLIIVSVL